MKNLSFCFLSSCLAIASFLLPSGDCLAQTDVDPVEGTTVEQELISRKDCVSIAVLSGDVNFEIYVKKPGDRDFGRKPVAEGTLVSPVDEKGDLPVKHFSYPGSDFIKIILVSKSADDVKVKDYDCRG